MPASSEEYDRLKSQDSSRDIWQAIEDWRAWASFDWPELTPEEVDGWRDRAPGRQGSDTRRPMSVRQKRPGQSMRSARA